MDRIFLQLLNMSAAAGWLILAVLVLRLIMKNAPRSLTCILWGIVAIRLLCPFFLESPLSLIPSKQILSPYTVQYASHPSITSGIPALNQIVNPAFKDTFSPTAGASVNPLHIWMFFAGILWFSGFLALLLYGLGSFLQIRKTVAEAIPLQKNIWLCDHIGSPFILGVFRPRIYLPSDIRKDERFYVLAHEKAHLRRRDHWWKPFGYLLLSIYWFHPLVWISYILFCRDIEIACDETVIKDMGLDEKKAYSHALVSLSMPRRLVSICPLAFGEKSVKVRINQILHYKKPAFWITLCAFVICIAAAICFLTNPVDKSHMSDTSNQVSPNPQTSKEPNLGYGDDHQYEDGESVEINGNESIASLETDKLLFPLDQAIHNAIMEKKNGSYYPDYDFACCDFVMLEMTSDSLTDNTLRTVTCFGWVLYQQYLVSENGLDGRGGCHIPTVLTFKTDQGRYILEEYWEPRDGSYFMSDIQNKFPEYLVSDGIDSQKFIIRQQQSCYSQAIQSTGLETDAIISRLLDELCSDLGYSFDPQTIPSQNHTQYRELIKYGEYTLSYCLGRFNHGGETGLKGKIMALICEELLQTRETLPLSAADAATGQLWYDTLYAHASNLATPYLHLK